MGVSIDIHIYDYFELIQDIRKQVAEKASHNLPADRSINDFVERVLPQFGFRAGDKWLTLWNEYYEDYNAGSELFRAVEGYFGIDDVFLSGYTWFGGANAYEVLEELEIEWLGEEDE